MHLSRVMLFSYHLFSALHYVFPSRTFLFNSWVSSNREKAFEVVQHQNGLPRCMGQCFQGPPQWGAYHRQPNRGWTECHELPAPTSSSHRMIFYKVETTNGEENPATGISHSQFPPGGARPCRTRVWAALACFKLFVHPVENQQAHLSRTVARVGLLFSEQSLLYF